MRLVVMQPSYLPWLGYFDLINQADEFLFYDNVQFDKDGWRNRNRIKTSSGLQWVTVPVLTKGQNKPTNREIKINNAEKWARKQANAIRLSYSKAPFFNEIYESIEKIILRPRDCLFDLNLELIHWICNYLSLSAPTKCVSDLDVELPEGKNEKLIAICKSVGASEFYEPKGGEGYIDPEKFAGEGIQLKFQDFTPPTYPQLHGEFESHLSILDVLFNCGKETKAMLPQKVDSSGHPA